MSYSQYSVLSSVYNKENPHYLRRSIDSIISQRFVTDDFVIVKDGPLTKELEAILDEYSSKYNFIHVCGYEANKGLGAALNFGLAKCKNELVARMDTDDISLPNRFEKQIAAFNKDPELGILGSDILLFSDDENVIEGRKKMPSTYEEIYRFGKRRNPFNHPTVMYKKSIVAQYGGYNETQRGEDLSLFTKIVQNHVNAMNISEPLLLYRSNIDQFSRRTSMTDSKAVIRVIYNNYKSGYAGLSDLLYVIALQLAGHLISPKIGGFLYKKFFLNKS